MARFWSRAAVRPLFAAFGAVVLLSGLLPAAGLSSIVLADTGTGSVSLTTAGSPAPAETFDTLSNTAGSATNTTLPTGWYLTETGRGGTRQRAVRRRHRWLRHRRHLQLWRRGRDRPRLRRAPDRARCIPNFGAKFTNNTGVTITSLRNRVRRRAVALRRGAHDHCREARPDDRPGRHRPEHRHLRQRLRPRIRNPPITAGTPVL